MSHWTNIEYNIYGADIKCHYILNDNAVNGDVFLSLFGALNRIIFGVYYFAILWMEGWHMTLKCQLTSFHLKMTIFNTWLL